MPQTRSRPPELSLGKRLAFASIATVLFLALLELLLAITGVRPTAHDEDPFVGFAGSFPLFTERSDAAGEPVFATSRNKSAFFNSQRFPALKPAGTKRIFCLGGSTTYGRPYADPTSFAGWLREFLPEADADRRWEVINAGGISYASYRVAALMEELAGYEPDLFIVYTGHNEFLEERTYGELRRVPAPLRSLMGLLARTRTWTLLSRVTRGRGTAQESVEDGRSILPQEVQAKLDHSAGPSLYERDDALRAHILEHYRLSLTRIVRRARAAGADVVLVTPASNLKDCTPFKSQPSKGLDAPTRSRVDALAARARGESGKAALATLDAALELDPRNAGLLYSRGRARLEAGDAEGAEKDLTAARDEDVCPLRALSAMQEIVAAVAAGLEVPLVDYPALLRVHARERTGHAIVGEEFFLDHVHPTVEGHRLLALALIEEMTEIGLVEPGESWNATAIERVTRRVESAIDPVEHARALANLSLTLNWAGKDEESRRLALKALESGHEDPTMLMMVARHAAIEGDDERALAFFRRALAASPNSPVVHSQAGLLHSGRGDHEAAAAHFFLASLLWEDNEIYHEQLAAALSRRGLPRSALRSLLRAAALAPGDTKLQQRIARLRAELPGPERQPAPARIAVTRHASGFPRTISQSVAGPAGGTLLDGIWTEWYESGNLKMVAHYRAGSLVGTPARWSEEGERLPQESAR